MGVRILSDSNEGMACLYCSTSGVVFGPLFHGEGSHDADECAEAFLRWLDTTPKWRTYKVSLFASGRRDARCLTDEGLSQACSDWRDQSAKQFAREDACENGTPCTPNTVIGICGSCESLFEREKAEAV